MKDERRFRVPVVALSAALALFGCGKVERAEGSGSETHWVLSCQADSDCAALGEHVGCRSGWCSADGATASTAPASSPATEPARAPEEQDGTLPPLDQLGDAELAAQLCDGSEGARVIHESSIGYSEEDSFWFGANYGPSRFVVDGQCRFWGAASGSGRVFTRQLDIASAARLARAVRFGQQPPWSESNEAACSSQDTVFLWTPQGAVACTCDCYEFEVQAEWSQMFSSLSGPRFNSLGLFAGAEPVTGPARLLLYRSGPPQPEADSRAQAWPLARPPAQAELAPAPSFGSWGEAWGVLLANDAELELLRSARDRGNSLDVRFTSLLWSDGDVTEELQMHLLDEIPPALAADIQSKLP